MKQTLKDFAETEGYNFTWETECMECHKNFECQDFLPDRIIKKMLNEKSDDCVAEFVGDSSSDRLMYCPKCRKDMGMG